MFVPKDSVVVTSTHLNVFHVGKELGNGNKNRHLNFREQPGTSVPAAWLPEQALSEISLDVPFRGKKRPCKLEMGSCRVHRNLYFSSRPGPPADPGRRSVV